MTPPRLMPVPRPGVMDAPIYVPGTHLDETGGDVAILSANENPAGASPAAGEAVSQAVRGLHRYPDGGSVDLRKALGELHGLNPERIICGAGSDELITFLIRAYAGPGDEVLYSEHGFAMYRITALTVGATPVAAPETDLRTDVEAVLSMVSPATKLVFIANPNNPTGSYLSRDEVADLAKRLPGNVILALDAAYAEYVSRNDYGAGEDIVDQHPNVVMLRTFSKIYGLAALRLGWAYGQEDVIGAMNRLRSPFNVNAAAQTAGLAAVRDQAFVERSRTDNERWLGWMSDRLTELGLHVPPSVGNFVLAGFADEETANRAAAYLESRGVVPRKVGSYRLPTYLRITIGLERECHMLVDALRDFMASEASA